MAQQSKNQNLEHREPRRLEYQTVRLFGVLALLTLLFVLVVRLVQNGPTAETRQPASQGQQK
jgi:hypothetical protein